MGLQAVGFEILRREQKSLESLPQTLGLVGCRTMTASGQIRGTFQRNILLPALMSVLVTKIPFEDEGSMFFRNICVYLQVHTALQPRRPTSTSLSL
jgi:hypothetical protein